MLALLVMRAVSTTSSSPVTDTNPPVVIRTQFDEWNRRKGYGGDAKERRVPGTLTKDRLGEKAKSKAGL